MKNIRIVRVDIVDNEEYDGDQVLDTIYLVNPDMDKLLKLKARVERRFDTDDEPTFGCIDEIQALITKQFKEIEVDKVEISW